MSEASRREGILVRMLAVMDDIEGMKKAWRNKETIDEGMKPCSRLFDGDETLSDQVTTGREARGALPSMLVMRPQVGIALDAEDKDIGTRLNTERDRFIAAVMNDASLLTLIGTAGRIRYEGCTTELNAGRAVAGEMFLQFAITYQLTPSKLPTP